MKGYLKVLIVLSSFAILAGFLALKYKNLQELDPAEVKRLLKQLDDKDIKKRESASRLLEEIGWRHPKLVDILEKRLKENISAEVHWRLKIILEKLKKGKWEELPPAPIEARSSHTTIWTGKKMLIWGGYKGKYIRADSFPADGAIYDPATGKWEKLPEAPIKGRFKHTAIWTGKEMIVWGGNRARFGEGPEAFRGATYDPRSHKWKKLPKGPIKRNGHTAIWTGRRMIIWGGFGRLGYYANGASYDPASGKWERIPKAPIPGRSEHTAIWTGKKMIVWGGQKTTKEGPVRIFADGAIYDPESRKWEKLPKAPIKARIAHTAIWTGKKMIIWGGIGSRGSFGDGAAYDPESGSWEKLPKAPVEARAYHTAIWTGRRMIIWGGRKGIEELTDGAIYEPKVSSWKKIPEILTKISSRTAIWTGKEMIIWGAKGGAIYTPPPMREKD